MGMRNFLVFLFYFALLSNEVCSQSLKGIVLDKKTKLPIESAAVYFDGTTIGTSTNSDGVFRIEMSPGVTSPLIISYLGYQRITLDSYHPNTYYSVLLEEDLNTLDEIVIKSDDGMSKTIKLKEFRREFLGHTDNGNACTILNESDLILRYNNEKKQLTASARKPLLIRNDQLKYLVSFDIQDFIIEYKYVDLLLKHFSVNSVIYSGTSFYKDLDTLITKKVRKRRDKAYKGSSLHFMRSLSKKQLEEEDYRIFDGSFEVPPYKFISVNRIDESQNVQVVFDKQLSILYDKKLQSSILVKENFVIDSYGNYAPIDKVLFGGYMGNQRLGDSLPIDYFLLSEK